MKHGILDLRVLAQWFFYPVTQMLEHHHIGIIPTARFEARFLTRVGVWSAVIPLLLLTQPQAQHHGQNLKVVAKVAGVILSLDVNVMENVKSLILIAKVIETVTTKVGVRLKLEYVFAKNLTNVFMLLNAN